MLPQRDIRQAIQREFPQFQEKSQLQSYYMNYEYPDRQQKLFDMWKRLLIFVCREQKRLILYRDEIAEIFVFFQMKPLPLDNVLKQLVRDGELIEKAKFAAQYSSKPQPAQNGGLVSKVFGYFFSGKQDQPLVNQYFFKGLVDDAVALAKKQLPAVFQGQNCLPEGLCIKALEKQLYLTRDGDFLLDVLIQLGEVHRTSCSLENQLVTIILYSEDPTKHNERFYEIFKVEFIFGKMQGFLENKITTRSNILDSLTRKIKECLHNGNKVTAKQYMKDFEVEKDAISNLMLRKRILAKQLNQLEVSQGNIQMMHNLENSKAVLQSLSKELDMDKLIDLKVAADEIKKSSQDVERLFAQMANADMKEESDLFRQLQQEVLSESKQKMQNDLNVSMPIHIPSMMEVEVPPAQDIGILNSANIEKQFNPFQSL